MAAIASFQAAALPTSQSSDTLLRDENLATFFCAAAFKREKLPKNKYKREKLRRDLC